MTGIDRDICNRCSVSWWSCSDHYSEDPDWEMLSIKAPAITDLSTKVRTWASDNSIHWFSVLTRWNWVQLWQSMCSCWHLPGLLFISKAKRIHEKQNKHLIKEEKVFPWLHNEVTFCWMVFHTNADVKLLMSSVLGNSAVVTARGAIDQLFPALGSSCNLIFIHLSFLSYGESLSH